MKRQICFIVMFLLLLNVDIYAKDSILWFKTDHPPYYNSDEKGVHDLIVEYITPRLSEYDHVFIKSNYKRALEEIKQRNHAILVGIFKTPERQKYVSYPEMPLYLSLSPGLIIKKEDKRNIEPFIKNDGFVDLEKYITAEKRVVGVSIGRSYSKAIDDVIEKYKNIGVLLTRTSQDIIVGQLQLLLSERIDAYFAIPVSANYSAKALGLNTEKISILPVYGVEPCTPVYFGLPYSDWGDGLLRKIVEIVNEKEALVEFAGYYESWLQGAMKDQYRKIYNDYFSSTFNVKLNK